MFEVFGAIALGFRLFCFDGSQLLTQRCDRLAVGAEDRVLSIP